MRVSSSSLLLAVAAACAEPAAESITTTEGKVSAVEYRVVLTEVATVRGPHVREDSWLAFNSSGQIYLAPSDSDDDVQVLAPDGQVTSGFRLENQGEGDADIQAIYTSPSDQLHIFEKRQHRWLIVTGDGALVSRSEISDVPYSVAFPGGDRAVLQTMIFTPERIGFPLQLMETDGTITRSFGADPPSYLPSKPQGRFRATASAGDGRVWAAYLNRYQIELWDTLGVRLKTVIREASWFRPWSEDPGNEPIVNDLRVDEAGLLWTLILVPDSSWNPSPPQTMAPGPMVVSDLEERYDTVIEVIDPLSGRLLAHHRDSRVFRRFTRDFVYSHRLDEGGDLAISVLRVHLEATTN